MAKIIVAGPSQNIHRFLLPPHSKHVMSHKFPGGGVVLAQILHRLVAPEKMPNDVEESRKKWEAALKKWEEKNKLPDRFIRLAPFAAAPALNEHLRPDTKFLRVEEVEDGDDFYDSVQAAFGIESGLLKRNVFIVGGKQPSATWAAAADAIDTMGEHFENGGKCQAGDIVFILAKTSGELTEHRDEARKMGAAGEVVIVGQIDVSNLAACFPLQTDTSYERTVGDICRATLPKKDGQPTDPTMLEDLFGTDGLDHLIIRIGNAACMVVSRHAPPAASAGKVTFDVKLFCHPDRCAPTTFPGLGYMLAYDMLLCASVVNQIARSNAKDPSVDVLKGARIGVQATYRCFIEGFGIFDPKDDKLRKSLVEIPPDTFFAKFIQHGIKAQSEEPADKTQLDDPAGKASTLYYPHEKWMEVPEAKYGVCEPDPKAVMEFDVHYDTACSPYKFWRMVVPGEKGADEAASLSAGRDHLLRGKSLPLVALGKQKLVDRQEVEDYLYLQRLLLSYHADSTWRRPLCIGVFGQPGAGKSFGVKQLVSEMSANSGAFSKDSTEVNLSQLRSLDELAECFHLVRDKCLQPPIPLVFFDEFDSSFEDRTFGWLKYFLAPMQDGEFFSKGKKYSFGKAIFVFAGGVNHSFAEFNERARNLDFCDAKGPDFISRLRGILNISSMNQPEGETVEHLYRIRRAVFLRWKLEEKLGKPDKKETELIDKMLAEAFLTIPRYKHGARSMEAILDMSSLVRGQKFTHSNLPPRDQLDMHVDAREFLRLAGVLTPLSKG